MLCSQSVKESGEIAMSTTLRHRTHKIWIAAYTCMWEQLTGFTVVEDRRFGRSQCETSTRHPPGDLLGRKAADADAMVGGRQRDEVRQSAVICAGARSMSAQLTFC